MKIFSRMKKSLVLSLMYLLPLVSNAQWRIGVTGGGSYNVISADKHYMIDYDYDGRWGGTVGITGGYDFNSWFGLRADINWTQKNYRFSRDYMVVDHKNTNNYFQMPVMSSFRFGSQKFHGFCNLGVYGGYWSSGRIRGFDTHVFNNKIYYFKKKYEFNDERDQRWDFGLVGGLGMEYMISSHWAAQVELRYYYSTTSTRKDNSINYDPNYNSTTTIQGGISYIF